MANSIISWGGGNSFRSVDYTYISPTNIGNMNTLSIKLTDKYFGPYMHFGGLLITRYSTFTFNFATNGNKELFGKCTLIGNNGSNNETLSISFDNTNHIITITSDINWNNFKVILMGELTAAWPYNDIRDGAFVFTSSVI